MTTILITGISGTGKSTLSKALADKGFKSIDLDSTEWSVWTEDITSSPDLGTPVKENQDWIWNEEKVSHLLQSNKNDTLFISGCAENMGQFMPFIDCTVLLSASEKVIDHRLKTRTTNSYGKTEEERQRVVEQKQTIEPVLRKIADYEFDSNQDLEELINKVVDLL